MWKHRFMVIGCCYRSLVHDSPFYEYKGTILETFSADQIVTQEMAIEMASIAYNNGILKDRSKAWCRSQSIWYVEGKSENNTRYYVAVGRIDAAYESNIT